MEILDTVSIVCLAVGLIGTQIALGRAIKRINVLERRTVELADTVRRFVGTQKTLNEVLINETFKK